MPPPPPFTYEYPRPSVTVDCVLFAMREADLAVLLVKRKNAPFRGAWALPGGYVNQDEPLERAALRELQEETGLGAGVALEQLRAFGDPGRDPRGHTVTVAFFGLLVAAPQPLAGDDAADAAWQELGALPPLAFDHDRIIACARQELERRLLERPATLPLPARFTLAELRKLHEAVRGHALRPRAFQAWIQRSGVVEPVPSQAKAKRGAARLYRFKARS